MRWPARRVALSAPSFAPMVLTAQRRCFCDAPKAVVDTWEDPRGTWLEQKKAYDAELKLARKQYGAEVAETQARIRTDKEEKEEMLRKVNAKVNDPELLECVLPPSLPSFPPPVGQLSPAHPPLTCRPRPSPPRRKKLEREQQQRDFRIAVAEGEAKKRAFGARRYARKEASINARHRTMIAEMVAMEPTWIHEDEVEDRIAHALDNPIRIDV